MFRRMNASFVSRPFTARLNVAISMPKSMAQVGAGTQPYASGADVNFST